MLIGNPLERLCGVPMAAVLAIVENVGLTDQQKGERLVELVTQLGKRLTVAVHDDLLGDRAAMSQATEATRALKDIDPEVLLAMAKRYTTTGDRTMYMAWHELSAHVRTLQQSNALLSRFLTRAHWQTVLRTDRPQELVFLRSSRYVYILHCLEDGQCKLFEATHPHNAARIAGVVWEFGRWVPVLHDNQSLQGQRIFEVVELGEVALLGGFDVEDNFEEPGDELQLPGSAQTSDVIQWESVDIPWLVQVTRELSVDWAGVVAKGHDDNLRVGILGVLIASRSL